MNICEIVLLAPYTSHEYVYCTTFAKNHSNVNFVFTVKFKKSLKVIVHSNNIVTTRNLHWWSVCWEHFHLTNSIPASIWDVVAGLGDGSSLGLLPGECLSAQMTNTACCFSQERLQVCTPIKLLCPFVPLSVAHQCHHGCGCHPQRVISFVARYTSTFTYSLHGLTRSVFSDWALFTPNFGLGQGG